MLKRTFIFAFFAVLTIGCSNPEQEEDAGETSSGVTDEPCSDAWTPVPVVDQISAGSSVKGTPRRVQGSALGELYYRIKDNSGALKAPTIHVRVASGYRYNYNLKATFFCGNEANAFVAKTFDNGGTEVTCHEGLPQKGDPKSCATTADFQNASAPVSHSGLRLSVDCAGPEETGVLKILIRNAEVQCHPLPPLLIDVTD
jgi:hypothetical protein